MLARDSRRFSLVLGSAILLALLCVRLLGPAGRETLLGLQVGDWPGGGSPTSPPHTSSSSALEVAAQAAALAQSQQSILTDSSKDDDDDDEAPLPTRPSRFFGASGEILGFQPPSEVRPGGSGVLHTEIFSVSTKDKRYFPIRMGSAKVLNPNIIPHPRLEAAWIVVAQKMGGDRDGNGNGNAQPVLAVEPSLELVCTAMFIDDALTCIGADGRGFGEPTTLPLQPTSGDGTKCTGELGFFNLNVGPHDARVFYGPRDPYTIYGSNSNFTCFGQWISDFRGLVPEAWGARSDSGRSTVDDEDDDENNKNNGGSSSSTWSGDDSSSSPSFSSTHHELASPGGTELQRPPPYGAVEKNWFLFWDSDNVHYVHYDMTPRRAFARLNGDGSVGGGGGGGGGQLEDLGQHTAGRDAACLARYLPDPTKTADQHGPGFHESLHQATNSLSVTLCRRADAGNCVPDDSNTFIMAVVHHKVYRDFHSVYEPYVVVFRQRAPFEMFAVSARPLWVSGRQLTTTVRGGGGEEEADASTEMFYVTSVAWKSKGLKYHGYVDDVLFLAFGIEDERAGGIDVQAGSLLGNLGLCDDGEGFL
ncbi:hypothetical protein DHEL01_v209892 [Diaporthe helianthi]|uniref:Uncharacterized protein n=1 Tax=Diaporthe helianthi TaxID=158607 RepID=A0A2P5HNA5_DIAHE|nr:hypothetical protein DHEL01_v209892 [Diaporthe helianthi]